MELVQIEWKNIQQEEREKMLRKIGYTRRHDKDFQDLVETFYVKNEFVDKLWTNIQGSYEGYKLYKPFLQVQVMFAQDRLNVEFQKYGQDKTDERLQKIKQLQLLLGGFEGLRLLRT